MLDVFSLWCKELVQGTNTLYSVEVYSDQHASVSHLELGGEKEMDWHTFCVLPLIHSSVNLRI